MKNFAGFAALRETSFPANSLNVFYHEKHEMHEKFWVMVVSGAEGGYKGIQHVGLKNFLSWE